MPRRQDKLPFREELVQGCHLIVGFSGGADSVTLLHYLFTEQERLGCTIEAAHLNHCFRGAESERDEAFVRTFCAERGILLTVKRVNVAKLADECGLSEETCGREVRYAFFEELRALRADGEKPVRVATAHTLSDDLETVLFRMARGTGLDGLCGIPAKRNGIVRPLLGCTRAMIEGYCAAHDLPFAEDSTNRDVCYARNRIRLRVVPELREVNDGVEENFLRQKEALTEDRDFLEQQTDALLESARLDDGFDASILRAAHPAMQRRAALRLLREQGCAADQKNILALVALLQKGQGRTEASDGYFTVRRGKLRYEKNEITGILPVTIAKSELADGLYHPVQIEFAGRKGNLPQKPPVLLYLRVVSAKDWVQTQKVYEKLLFFAMDYDTIIGSLTFRSRMAGDVLAQPARGRRTLKRLFSEAGLTAAERQTALVAADEETVLWAQGFDIDRRVALRPETERVLLAFRAMPEEL